MSDDLISRAEQLERQKRQQPARAKGWHPDPERPGKKRYWDGERWTGNLTTGNAEETPVVALGYVLAVFLAPLGIIVGLVIAFRGRSTGHGVAMVIIGLLALSYAAGKLAG